MWYGRCCRVHYMFHFVYFLVNRRHFTVMGINNMLLLFVQVTL